MEEPVKCGVINQLKNSQRRWPCSNSAAGGENLIDPTLPSQLLVKVFGFLTILPLERFWKIEQHDEVDILIHKEYPEFLS